MVRRGVGAWRRTRVRLEDLEVAEAPLYRGARGEMLKVLLSSACRLDCLYCPWRRGSPVERRRWDPGVLARVALRLWREGRIGAVFISSGLYGDPERVTEDIVEAAVLLRRLGYRGYLHLRLMPGAPAHLVRRAAEVADRVGLNLETVDASRFSEVAPSKGGWSLDLLSKLLYAARVARSADTQLVVGVAGETDEEHIRLMAVLASRGVSVVYHSPFTPIPWTPLASRPPAPRRRAAVLHQAWRLIRDYHIGPRLLETLLDDHGMLPEVGDLKEELARRNPHLYPVDPAAEPLERLLLVPGIGPATARRIIEARREGRLTLSELRGILGPRWRKAAKYLDLAGLRA